MKMTHRFALKPLATACALCSLTLAGCKSAPPSEANIAPLAQIEKFKGGTLADLENREIVINSADLQKSTVEDALRNYQAATDILQSNSARVDTLKRMADLTAKTAQARELRNPMARQKTEKDLEAERKIDAQIDTMLYKSFMQGVAGAQSKQEATAYMDLAGSVAGNIDTNQVKVDYTQAIDLYKEVLKSSKNPKERQETYYKLARTLDTAGLTNESISTLQKLAEEYPNSPYYVEAEFRRGEVYFSQGDYLSAVSSYDKVIKNPNNKDFYDQALYKLGWSHYKSADFDSAIQTFFTVAEVLQQRLAQTEGNKKESYSKLLADTYRVISLSFTQQDGAKSAKAWLAKVGGKPYEADIYDALGRVYLNQQRFKDAADAFDTFVETHPLDVRAPEFSSATIKAYQDGGFPTLVLPAKENFVRHYGLKSAFWAKADDAKRQQLLPFLQSHLMDLAQYHHSTGLKTKNDAELILAAGWYRDYLATSPAETQAIETNQLLAEALYTAKRYEEAIVEFEKTAYSYKNNPKAVDAAYFSLAAYQTLEDQFKGSAEEKDQLWKKKVAAQLRFAKAFPADKNAAPILADVTDEQLARKDTAGAIQTAQLIIAMQPAAPAKIVLDAWKVVANGEFDLGNAEAAEKAYASVLAFDDSLLIPAERATYQERLAASVYKQAEKLRDTESVDKAVSAFLRVGEVVPTSKLRPIAEFDAATLLLNSGQHAYAIQVLEAFRKNYPTHELGKTIPEKLALSYEKTGNFPLAAAEYESISANNLKTEPELAREALWQAAELREKAKQPQEAARLYDKYMALFPKPVANFAEAQYRMLKFAEENKDAIQTDRWLQALIKTHATAGNEQSPRTAYLAAMASFRLAEPAYQHFASIPLKLPLKTSLAAKKEAMKTSLDTYNRILAYGVAEYTTASNYRIAEIYRKLAADLLASEKPASLNELELEQYTILLEEQATPFEDKAIGLYIANANLVKQNVYDEYVRQSIEALAKLSPGRYNKREQSEALVEVIF